MAATFEGLDLLGSDLLHPRPRPRFASPVPPPPRVLPREIALADLDAPAWPGAANASTPVEPARVEAPWIKVTPPIALERVVAPEPLLELDPDEEAPRGPNTLVPADECDEDDISVELLELEAPDEDELAAIIEPATVELAATWAPRTTGRRIAPRSALLGPIPHPGAEIPRPREDDGSQQPVAEDAFDAFESAWFADEPVVLEGQRRVAWWEVVLPVSAGLGATSMFAAVIAIVRAWG